MINELLLIGSVVVIYGTVLLAYKLFGKAGMYAMTIIATVLANIEVLILIEGFGMGQTLGNVMFASTYLITDILSENEGKESAAKAVWLGVFAAAVMLVFTQYWMLYTPANADWASPHISAIFSTTPRMLAASLVGYIISQRFDVWLYHKWWEWCKKHFGDSKKGLWIRNNGSTMISQLLNTLLYTFLAFYGTYSMQTLVSIFISSYALFCVTSLLDTPFVYWARIISEKHHGNN